MHRILRPDNIIRYYIDRFAARRPAKPEEGIIIAGTTRSGSTWLMEQFDNVLGYRTVFEPLHPAFFPSFNEIKFNHKLFLDPKTPRPELKEYMHAVLSGKIISRAARYPLWPDDISKRIKSNKLAVKMVRANRILPWMVENLTYRSVILLIRNPYSTISSQSRTGFAGYTSLGKNNETSFYRMPALYGYKDKVPTVEQLISEAKSIPQLNSTVIDRLRLLKGNEGLLAAAWCMDYFIPLFSCDLSKLTIVFYEKLQSEGERAFLHLFAKIGVEVPHFWEQKGITRKSSTSLKLIKKGGFSGKLAKKQISIIYQVTSWFGLDFYNIDGSLNEKKFKEIVGIMP